MKGYRASDAKESILYPGKRNNLYKPITRETARESETIMYLIAGS